MIWHDIKDPADPELDRLAERYHLHPLHVEDCRHRNQNAKVEQQQDYLFVVLKSVEASEECLVDFADVDFFIGSDYLITVQEKHCSAVGEMFERTHSTAGKLRPDELFYRIMDAVVDSYYPILDRISDRIDVMEDRALTETSPEMLQSVFEMKRALIQLRRVLGNSRDLVGHFLRSEFPIIKPDLMPFLRDVYDHLIRNLDTVEMYRDLLTGATDLYLSTVANRTNQTMKVLAVFGALTTPALVVTGMYGMNIKHLPFAEDSHSFAIVTTMTLGISAILVGILRRYHWL